MHLGDKRALARYKQRLLPALWGVNVGLYTVQALVWCLYPTTPSVDAEVWSLLSAFLHASAFGTVGVWMLLHGGAAAAAVERTTVRMELRTRKLRELRVTTFTVTALLCLRVLALVTAAFISVAHPAALDTEVDAVASSVMVAYYGVTELVPVGIILFFQRHLPPTAPLAASGAYRVVTGREDAALFSPDTSSALRPSVDPDMSLLGEDKLGLCPPPSPASVGVGSPPPPHLPPPASPRRTSSFIANHAALASEETTKQVRLFANVKAASHVRSGLPPLATPPAARAPPALSARPALPSAVSALAAGESDLGDAFRPARPVQWTASGRVLLTWKGQGGGGPGARNWSTPAAPSWLARTGAAVGAGIARALRFDGAGAAAGERTPLRHAEQGRVAINSPRTSPTAPVAVPAARLPPAPWSARATHGGSARGLSLPDVSPIRVAAASSSYQELP